MKSIKVTALGSDQKSGVRGRTREIAIPGVPEERNDLWGKNNLLFFLVGSVGNPSNTREHVGLSTLKRALRQQNSLPYAGFP